MQPYANNNNNEIYQNNSYRPPSPHQGQYNNTNRPQQIPTQQSPSYHPNRIQKTQKMTTLNMKNIINSTRNNELNLQPNNANRQNYHHYNNYSPNNSRKIITSNQQTTYLKPPSVQIRSQKVQTVNQYNNKHINNSRYSNNSSSAVQEGMIENNNSLSMANYAIGNNSKSTGENKIGINNFNQNKFPATSKVMNLKKFVQENVKLRKSLLDELDKIKQKRYIKEMQYKDSNDDMNNMTTKGTTRDVTPTRYSKQIVNNLPMNKISPQSMRNLSQTLSPSQDSQILKLMSIKKQKQLQIQHQQRFLQQLKASNAEKSLRLQNIQRQTMNHSIHQTPLLRQKHLQIQYLSVQIQWLNQKNEKLKKLMNKKLSNQDTNIFQMYEQMCRQCEVLRKENNKKSQKLKKVFQKVNKLTGKEQNANMFLMNLKV